MSNASIETYQTKTPEIEQNNGIELPHSLKALESLGHINLAVVYVQLEVGARLGQQYGVDPSAFYITPAWWDENVGHNGTFQEMARSFDRGYAELVASKVSEIALPVQSEEGLVIDSTEQDRDFEIVEELAEALVEAEENAYKFAELVEFGHVDDSEREPFLEGLTLHVVHKYGIDLGPDETESIKSYLHDLIDVDHALAA